MARQSIEIDRSKLRAAVRKLAKEHVFYMLDDAIDLLPPSKLHKIARKYLDLKRLRPDGEKATKSSLLADVKAFEKASLAGEYYESFNVNSKNFGEQSTGTMAWIAECASVGNASRPRRVHPQPAHHLASIPSIAAGAGNAASGTISVS